MRQHDIKDVQIVFPLAARTATPTAVTISTPCPHGIFVIHCTAVTSSPSVVFTISGVDAVGEAIWTILASAAITGTGTTVLRVHPSLTASANTIAKDFLPQAIKIAPVHGNADSITYSMGFIGAV